MLKHWFEAIVLAAGSSTRMGRPKQLLRIGGETLIRRCVNTLVPVHPKPIVVTGAERRKIETELEDFAISICYNDRWPSGMASSLQCGLTEALKQSPDTSGVLVTLVDQPLVVTSHLSQLITKAGKAPNKAIVVTDYHADVGVPAYIGRSYFKEIFQISGDQGARYLFKSYKECLLKVVFPQAAKDVDTPEEWRDLLNDLGI